MFTHCPRPEICLSEMQHDPPSTPQARHEIGFPRGLDKDQGAPFATGQINLTAEKQEGEKVTQVVAWQTHARTRQCGVLAHTPSTINLKR